MSNPIYLALDVPQLNDGIDLVNKVKGHVGGIKLGLEFFCAHGAHGVHMIGQLGLPIFLDLKLHDIPNTVAGAMQANMDRMGGLIHSQRVLLALTQNGVSREDAYRLVQRNAMKVWESDGRLMLLDLLKQDEEVTAALSAEQLEERFDLEYHFKHVDTIFERVFG